MLLLHYLANIRDLIECLLVKDEKGDRETAIIDLLERIVKDTNAKVIDVALGWVRQKYDHTALATVTIIGARTVKQLDDNFDTLNLSQTFDRISQLNALARLLLVLLMRSLRRLRLILWVE